MMTESCEELTDQILNITHGLWELNSIKSVLEQNLEHILMNHLSGNTLRSIQSIEENHDDETSGSFNKKISII